MKGRSPVPPHIEKAVIIDRIAGLSTVEIAQKYKLHRVTVSRICSRARREAPQSEFANPNADYRVELKGKAITAVKAGLDDPRDSYKRAGVGIQTLKGIGEFQGDQPTGRGIFVEINLPPTLAMPEGCVNGMPPGIEGSKPLALAEKSETPEPDEKSEDPPSLPNKSEHEGEGQH